MNKQDYYDRVHEHLAKKYLTDTHIIDFIRSLATEKSWRQKELVDFLIQKLKTPNLSPERVDKYKKRLLFIGRIPEKDFEEIVTFEFEYKDQIGSELTEPTVATSINDQNT